MARRLVDISSPLKAGIRSDPPHMLPKIDYMDHHQTAPAMAEYMGVRVDQLPDGKRRGRAGGDQHPQRHPHGCALAFLLQHKSCAEAGRGAVLADRRRAVGLVLSAGREVGLPPFARRLRRDRRRRRGRAEADRSHAATVGVVIVNTAAGARYGQDDFVDRGCGIGKTATLWLLERGVRVVGTDGWNGMRRSPSRVRGSRRPAMPD